MRFRDRTDAGRRLAELLLEYRDEHPVVIALPRGGVPVGAEVAAALGAPLDIWIVRKVQPELEKLRARTVIVVDDGIATGGTARAALEALRELQPRKIVLAVPVASPDALARLSKRVDRVACLYAPELLGSIGSAYVDFRQVSDVEVREILEASRQRSPSGSVEIPTGSSALQGVLKVPANPRGIVLFACASRTDGSSRQPLLASMLQERGLATLVAELLAEDEARLDDCTGAWRSDARLLAARLTSMTKWVAADEALRRLPVGYFGAGAGTAAALVASCERTSEVQAIVSAGGRPDLAMYKLGDVRAATLFVVGGADTVLLEVNERAYARLGSERALVVIPGVGPRFEEPGALAEVGRLAAEWFLQHLAGGRRRRTQPSAGTGFAWV